MHGRRRGRPSLPAIGAVARPGDRDGDDRASLDAEGEARFVTSLEGLQLLLSGSASAYDAAGERLYQRGRGDASWPGALDQQAASVVADEPCRAMVLKPAVRGRLEQQDERLALTLYRYLLDGRLLARSLSE